MRFNSENNKRGRNERQNYSKSNNSRTKRYNDTKPQSRGQRKFDNDDEIEHRQRPQKSHDYSNRQAQKYNRFDHDDDFEPKYKKQRSFGNKTFKRDFNNKSKNTDSQFGEDKGIRLNRYIANAGVCSRRDAEQYILAGVITINGKVVTELATKVHYGDVVKFNNAPLMPEKKTYILLNKPKDYVTTTDDPHAEKTVMDLIGDAAKSRVYPVGRLDRSTTGLLLLTNDGDLAEHLCHPRYNKQKIYQVTLDKKVAMEDIEKLLNGVELEDGPANADEVEYCNPDDQAEVGVVIHSGRNRIVRRMFESLGYKVKKLDRVYYAGLTKKNLPRGKWRFLTEKEVVMLKRGTYN